MRPCPWAPRSTARGTASGLPGASTSWRSLHRCCEELTAQLLLQLGQALKFLVAVAALHVVNAWHFERLARGEPAGGLLLAAAEQPLGQARRAAQGVGLELSRDAVGPAGRDLVLGKLAAAGGITEEGIGRHWHGRIQ